MFNFFKNKGLEVDAAVDGGLIPISEVNDDVSVSYTHLTLPTILLV